MTPLAYAILGYVVVQLLIGLWAARRVRTEDDFLVAGRKLGTWTVAMSVFATWFGAETCISAAGQIHAEGLGVNSVEPFGFGMCLVAMGLLLAAPLWRRGITTLADLFRQRFGMPTERLAAIVTIPASVLWAAAQIRAFGEILSASTGMSVATTVAIASILAIVYTGIGGLLADVVTDVVQGIVLVLGLFVLLACSVTHAGGVAEFCAQISNAPPRPAPAGGMWLETVETWALVVIGSLVAQEIVARTLAAQSASSARRGALFGGMLYLAVGSIPVLLALANRGAVGSLEHADGFLPTLAQQQLPTVLFVVFAGALVSAILSTVDSALLAAAAIFARNLLPSRSSGGRGRLAAARAGVVLFGLIAWLLASSADSVFDLVAESSGFASAGVVVTAVFGLGCRFGGVWAGTAALLGGAVAWVGFAYVVGSSYPFLLSLGIATVAYLAGSAIDARRG